VAIKARAYRYRAAAGLYSDVPPVPEAGELKLIPYFLWANRGENEMRVYIRAERGPSQPQCL